MKQIIQDLSKGDTILEEVPVPRLKHGSVLIQTTHSLVSLGTERMLVEFGKANFIDKARQQPDKVKMVLDKIKTDGLKPTLNSVFNKLGQPLPLGYCNVGIVKEVGKGVSEFNVGDRVASNGNHAEFVSVGRNLCAKIPDEVDNESAAFTVMGAIALEGIRLIKPDLGENIVVSGLGLVGLLAVQILKANGCRVLGIDYNEKRCNLAKKFGAETVNLSNVSNPIHAAKEFSRNRGVDGVLICTATDSDEVIHQAATMCRKKARIVLVGTSGLNIKRDDFFEKEISFMVSNSLLKSCDSHWSSFVVICLRLTGSDRCH